MNGFDISILIFVLILASGLFSNVFKHPKPDKTTCLVGGIGCLNKTPKQQLPITAKARSSTLRLHALLPLRLRAEACLPRAT